MIERWIHLEMHPISQPSESDTWALVSISGKAAVSRIVDYLRHTTNRGLEDSGLGELCSMLDPDQKDVSVDLETYRAIMKKWIEDRKRKRFRKGGATEEPRASVEDLEFKVLEYSSEAKETHDWMNVTSGSLEAFGGDVSKGDMETSDLLICVADLQWNNQQLQEENKELKLTVEAVHETINKLLGDNELLCQQLKSPQHSVLKAESLEEDLEEAKNKLNLSEEKRQQLLCRNTQLEKEIQSLVDKITSLQEENIRNSMDTDRLEKKILELCKNASDLQSQARIYESLVVKKEASLIQKEQDIKELKLTIVEYSSTIETLRAEKKNLVENMQDMQQELISNGLSFPLLGKCNSDIPEGTNSLHCELELAQPSEPSSSLRRVSIAALPRSAGNAGIGVPLAQLCEPDGDERSDKFNRRSSSWGRLGAKPDEKRPSLQRFISTYSWAEYEDEHSETKQAGAKGYVQSIAALGKGNRMFGMKCLIAKVEPAEEADDQVEAFHSACEEPTSLKSKLEEAISEQQKPKDVNAALTSTFQLIQEKVEDQKSE
ncbi:inositol 1,4,5-triphosphate receptor associated 2-like [Aegotheles albertisi]